MKATSLNPSRRLAAKIGVLLLLFLTTHTARAQSAEEPFTLVPQEEADREVAKIIAEASAAQKRLKDAEDMRSLACNEVRTDPKKYRECSLIMRRSATEYLDQLTLILAMLEVRDDLKRVTMKKSQDPKFIDGFMQGIPRNVVLSPKAQTDEVWVLEYSPKYSGSRAVVDELAAMLSSGHGESSVESGANSLLFPLVRYPHPYDWNIRVFLYPSQFKATMSTAIDGLAIPFAQGISALSSYEMHTVFWGIQNEDPSDGPRPPEKKRNPYRSNDSLKEGSLALESGKATIVFQDYAQKDDDVIEIEFRGEKRKVYMNEDSSFDIDLKPDESLEMKITVLSEGSIPPCTLRAFAVEFGMRTSEVVLGGQVGEVATLKVLNPTPFEDEDWDRIGPIVPRKPKPRSPFWSPVPQK